jgi:hypothetical protein
VTDPIEETARRIAELGSGAVLRRLRPAFDHAAVTYASRITIRSDELERMLEQAAQRADATIWRRALASVAMDELDIGLFEALEHPAVIRAQEMVGAPALDPAALSPAAETRAEPLAQGEAPPQAETPSQAERPPQVEALPELPALPDELDPHPDSEPEAETLADPEVLADPVAPAELDPEALPEEVDAQPVPKPKPDGLLDRSPPVESADLAPGTIRLAAVHLNGIENLPRAGKYLELRFSEAGFDVVDAEGGDVIGRLRWDEIDALELPSGRSSLGRRRRRARAQLVVRSDRGEASFEIRGLTDVELREHLAPIMTMVRGAHGAR